MRVYFTSKFYLAVSYRRNECPEWLWSTTPYDKMIEKWIVDLDQSHGAPSFSEVDFDECGKFTGFA